MANTPPTTLTAWTLVRFDLTPPIGENVPVGRCIATANDYVTASQIASAGEDRYVDWSPPDLNNAYRSINEWPDGHFYMLWPVTVTVRT